jgi:hypothetical protein
MQSPPDSGPNCAGQVQPGESRKPNRVQGTKRHLKATGPTGDTGEMTRVVKHERTCDSGSVVPVKLKSTS